MTRVKESLKKIVPRKLFKLYKKKAIKKDFDQIKNKYKLKVNELKRKSSINVVFFVIHSSVWKYDGLYKLLEDDEFFNPVIIVCPYGSDSDEQTLNEMEKTYSVLSSKKYNVYKSFNSKSGNWVDVKKDFRPDIIFYSVPYNYTRENYQLKNFDNVLNCYVPYFFVTNGNHEGNFDLDFHNLAWKLFYETEIHKSLAEQHARNKGENVLVTGYPGLDPFINKKKIDKGPWKSQKHSVKRIIWAPHHTIEGQGSNLNYSNFIQYYKFFQEILLKYENVIEIAFKPHPFLKGKLYNNKDWGKEKTDNYYNFWKNQANSILCESDYTELFLSSDALIHDCSSFMAEYLATKKPALYLLRDEGVKKRINSFGIKALEQHYIGRNTSDITKFIEDILNEDDRDKEKRVEFVNTHLTPPDNRTASENIYNHLKLIFS